MIEEDTNEEQLKLSETAPQKRRKPKATKSPNGKLSKKKKARLVLKKAAKKHKEEKKKRAKKKAKKVKNRA